MAASLSANSWLQVESVKRKLTATARHLNLNPDLPMDPDTVMNITLEWIRTGLRSSTIRTYLGRIATIHQLSGLRPPKNDPLLDRLLCGWEHTQPEARGRLAVTPPVLWAMYQEMTKADWHPTKKIRFWVQ